MKPTKRNGAKNVETATAVEEIIAETAGRAAIPSTPLKRALVIKPLRQGRMLLKLKGAEPLLMAKFSSKAQRVIADKMREGSSARSKKVRPPRDFAADTQEALHKFADGSGIGFPASAFRAAAISACRLVGFKMTLAKLSIWVRADGLSEEGIPLVRIAGDWEMNVAPVRNATGVMDLRARPLFRKWEAGLVVEFDLDQFAPEDVLNLMVRVGRQVGIGEGRPDSRMSAGLGYGLFDVVSIEGTEGGK